jgi:hypothetical protein
LPFITDASGLRATGGQNWLSRILAFSAKKPTARKGQVNNLALSALLLALFLAYSILLPQKVKDLRELCLFPFPNKLAVSRCQTGEAIEES